MRTLKSLFARAAPPAVTVGGLLIVWEIAVDAGHISQRALASPSQIAASIIKTWPDLWEATAITTYEAITGFLIAAVAGVLIGIGLYVSKTLYRGIYPLLAAAQTIPLITIAPLFMIWFGFEPLGKIVIVAVFGVFPVAVQTCRGMLAVPQFYEDVALTCGATRAWALWHVKLRVAARQVFGGLRISAAYVFGTAVTAEYLGAMNGLGIWLQAAFNSFRTPLIFSATIMVVALTALLLTIISLAERLLLGPDDTIAFNDAPAYGGNSPYAGPSQFGTGEPPLDKPYYGCSFGKAFLRFWKKYATFSGRAASRSARFRAVSGESHIFQVSAPSHQTSGGSRHSSTGGLDGSSLTCANLAASASLLRRSSSSFASRFASAASHSTSSW